MSIGPMELFFIAVLCSAPLLVIFIIAEIVISVKNAKHRRHKGGPYYAPWNDPGDEDQ